MGLEEMENRIRELGEKEINSIMKEAENEVKKVRNEFEKEAEKRYNEIIAKAKREAEFVKRRVLADFKMKAREMVENRKNELVEEVFEKARKKILSSNRKEMKRMLEKLANDGKKQIDNPEILIDSKYKGLLKGAKAAKINDFGVVVKDRKGEVKIYNTLTNKLEQLNNLLRHDVAKVLFGHGKNMRNR